MKCGGNNSLEFKVTFPILEIRKVILNERFTADDDHVTSSDLS